jgi:hypothetical protein
MSISSRVSLDGSIWEVPLGSIFSSMTIKRYHTIPPILECNSRSHLCLSQSITYTLDLFRSLDLIRILEVFAKSSFDLYGKSYPYDRSPYDQVTL